MIREPAWKAIWRVNRVLPIALFGVLILNSALFLFMNYRMEVKASRTQAEYIQLQAEERRTQSGRDDSESEFVIYSRGIEDLQKFKQSIPSKSELSGLVDELFSLADRAGLVISSVQYSSKDVTEHNLLQYMINYQVAGNYKQIKKMIHMIEQSDRLIAIDKLSLGSARKGESVSLSLTLTTFFRMEQI